jgi:hypothetical protein
MDFGKALTFITEDPRWQQKIAIGVGLILVSTLLTFVLIGVIGFLILLGYSVRLLQNVRDGQPYPLPEWDQWGEDLTRGFKLCVVTIVWGLPILIFTVPLGIGGALMDPNSGDAGLFLGNILVVCGGCLAALYGLFLTIMTPGISIAFARDEQITSGLQFSEIWVWTQEHLGQVILVALIGLVAAFIINLVGGIAGALLCLVGLIVTLPLASLVTSIYTYHLYGQLAYAYPFGGSRIEPLVPITPPSEMAPGVAPIAPITPIPPSEEPPVSTTGEYPGSGIDDSTTTPPPPAA